jgi:hypothetical protein
MERSLSSPRTIQHYKSSILNLNFKGLSSHQIDLTRLRELVHEIAEALTRQASIPAIKAEMGLIENVAGEVWWEDVTLGMLVSRH